MMTVLEARISDFPTALNTFSIYMQHVIQCLIFCNRSRGLSVLGGIEHRSFHDFLKCAACKL